MYVYIYLSSKSVPAKASSPPIAVCSSYFVQCLFFLQLKTHTRKWDIRQQANKIDSERERERERVKMKVKVPCGMPCTISSITESTHCACALCQYHTHIHTHIMHDSSSKKKPKTQTHIMLNGKIIWILRHPLIITNN